MHVQTTQKLFILDQKMETNTKTIKQKINNDIRVIGRLIALSHFCQTAFGEK